jgi:TRAP-type mannitol/chloroaromatic compound transport system permease large subunit
MGPLAGQVLAVAMVVAVCALLLVGYPVALTLAGVSLLFAAAGAGAGVLHLSLLGALPERVFGVMTNDVLVAIPLFIFMGVMLERSRWLSSASCSPPRRALSVPQR